MTGQQRPVTQFGAGPVRCAIWENQRFVNGRQVAILTATIAKRYKDRQGQWKSTTSMGVSDILLAIHCLQKAAGIMLSERTVPAEGAADDVVREEAAT